MHLCLNEYVGLCVTQQLIVRAVSQQRISNAAVLRYVLPVLWMTS